MQPQPFIESATYRNAGIIVMLAILLVHASLLVLYGHVDWRVALVDGLVFVSLFATSGFLSWFVTGILHAIQAQIALALLVQVVCIGGCFVFESLLTQETPPWFATTLLFRFVFGLLCWIVLTLWYRINQLKERLEDGPAHPEEENGIQADTIVTVPVSDTEDATLDRITVKDGSRIHIIQLDELLYIQASGDYVTFFTTSGQFIKEQTMKFFELHLPATRFVRIHRSNIINAEQIMRIELFGKDSYQVRLKNGVSLRASNAGYKLLKERLSL